MFMYHRIIFDQIKWKKERSECIIMHIKARQKYIGTSNKLLFLFLGEKVSSPLDCFLIMPTGLNSFLCRYSIWRSWPIIAETTKIQNFSLVFWAKGANRSPFACCYCPTCALKSLWKNIPLPQVQFCAKMLDDYFYCLFVHNGLCV